MAYKLKEPVHVRRKALKGGGYSLYLDVYVDGRRNYEFLKMYLVPERTREDRERNKETLRLADAIKAQRIVDIQRGRFNFGKKQGASIPFYDYYKRCAERHGVNMQRGNNWRSCLRLMQRYDGRESLRLQDITVYWLKGFKAFLDMDKAAYDWLPTARAFTENAKRAYFNKLRACLNQAMKDGLLQASPMADVDNYRETASTRMYLTIDEVRRLAAEPCGIDIVKRAFLFSCLTGLRSSDVRQLKWADVQQQGRFVRIIFTQKKTGGQEYLDISDEAAQWMGERGKADAYVFEGLPVVGCCNRHIAAWVQACGIRKHITFHCARHTFAVMMLDLGADIYTVSKLLGHSNLSTTQIYAKVLDRKKQEAVKLIPHIT